MFSRWRSGESELEQATELSRALEVRSGERLVPVGDMLASPRRYGLGTCTSSEPSMCNGVARGRPGLRATEEEALVALASGEPAGRGLVRSLSHPGDKGELELPHVLLPA